jgi:hypothetical protein
MASADWNSPVSLQTGRQDHVLPFALEYLSNVFRDWFPTIRGLLPTLYAFCLRVGKCYGFTKPRNVGLIPEPFLGWNKNKSE